MLTTSSEIPTATLTPKPSEPELVDLTDCDTEEDINEVETQISLDVAQQEDNQPEPVSVEGAVGGKTTGLPPLNQDCVTLQEMWTKNESGLLYSPQVKLMKM